MAEEREELGLEALRAAWGKVSPPPLPDAVEDSDGETRAVVDWMRTAFESLEVPPTPAVPTGSTARQAKGGTLLRFPVPAPVKAAAAAIVLALGSFLATRPEEMEQGEPAVVAGLEGSETEELSDEPVVAAIGPDHIEMRSGPVRLILLPPADGND